MTEGNCAASIVPLPKEDGTGYRPRMRSEQARCARSWVQPHAPGPAAARGACVERDARQPALAGLVIVMRPGCHTDKPHSHQHKGPRFGHCRCGLRLLGSQGSAAEIGVDAQLREAAAGAGDSPAGVPWPAGRSRASTKCSALPGHKFTGLDKRHMVWVQEQALTEQLIKDNFAGMPSPGRTRVRKEQIRRLQVPVQPHRSSRVALVNPSLDFSGLALDRGNTNVRELRRVYRDFAGAAASREKPGPSSDCIS